VLTFRFAAWTKGGDFLSENKNLKIAICSHVFRDIDFSVYFNHMWCISSWVKKYDVVFCGKRGLDAATARNQLVERAVEHNCTHMFFMDGDHLFPPETLPLLLESKDEAMVSGLVCKRGEGYQQVGFQKSENGSYQSVDLPLDGKVYQVRVCAFGCTLINMKYLLKLEPPYFRDNCIKTSNGDLYNFRSDVNLCEAFHEIKERCWIDTRILIGHHGYDSVIYPQQAKDRVACDGLLKSSLVLKKEEEGFYYEP